MRKPLSPRYFLYCILIGALIGSCIGLWGVFSSLGENEEQLLSERENVTNVVHIVIAVCIGLIVLMIDLLCIWGAIRPLFMRKIAQNGVLTTGTITEMRVIPHPSALNADEWVQKMMFALVIAYETENGRISKEFSPTCLTSRQALYPQEMEVGAEIAVRYHRRFPKIAVIANEKLLAGQQKESAAGRPLFIAVPVLITTLFLFFL